MRYYTFHVGDYSAHTRGLSLLEDLAYRRMIDEYHVNEHPLAGDPAEVARDIGMGDHAVEVARVLRKFFTLENGLHVHSRIAADIAENIERANKAARAGRLGGLAKAAQNDAIAGDSRRRRASSASDLLQQNPSSASDLLQQNPSSASDLLQQNPSRPLAESETLAKRTLSERLANQQPITNNQRKEGKQQQRTASVIAPTGAREGAHAREESPNVVPLDTVGKVAIALRRAGVRSSPHDEATKAISELGLGADAVADAVRVARDARPNESIGAAYVLGVLRNRAIEGDGRQRGKRRPRIDPDERDRANAEAIAQAERNIRSVDAFAGQTADVGVVVVDGATGLVQS